MEVEKGMDIEIAEGEGDSQNKVAHPEGTTSFFRTCVNGINALSGVGIVSIPYALSEGGWLSLMFFFSVAGLCYYTALLLQRCMNTDTDPLVRSYPDIGQYAFGRTGRLTISAFMCLELYLVAVEFLILESDNLHKLFPNAYVHLGGIKIGGEQMFVIISALIILPTTWLRNLGLLAYLSLVFWLLLFWFVVFFGSVQ